MTIDEAKSLQVGDKLFWTYGAQSQRGKVVSVSAETTRVDWDNGDSSFYRWSLVTPIQFANTRKVA
jgi:hypothetical protein